MKTNFKKSLAVLLAVLMLASLFSVTAFAATYTVTYMPGEGVQGETYVDEFSTSIKIRGATYTKEHFTHTGWSTTEGGTVTNAFNSTYRKKADLILYPVWTGDVYTITYNPGQYATSGSIVTDSAEYGASKALRGAIFARDGFVQTGWSLEDGGEKIYDIGVMSDVITGNITLYPYWAQIYSVTYNPGEFGVGNQVVDSVESGKTFSAKPAIFTRDGYRQVGWSFEDGGSKAYDLSESFVTTTKDIVLYPCWEQNIYDIKISTDELYFGDVCINYIAPQKQVFTITNNGNVPVTISVNSVSNFNVSVSNSFALAVGASTSVEVYPGSGYGIGDYSETLTFTVAENSSLSKTVNLEFSVSDHVFGVYKSNNDATYADDGTKSAECVKGCGAKDTIADLGSMKVYSIANNDAVGLVSSYEHHRTVRFTAYGSGMDDTALTIGKRFRPVSWFVSDEFNGEFEDGYEVVFTHTIFGDYTLTINYIEEKFDTATGEWVETGVTDTKVFDYTVGPTAEEEKEIIMPNTILGIIFALFMQLLSLLGIGG